MYNLTGTGAPCRAYSWFKRGSMKNTAQQFSDQKRDKKTKENKGGKVQTLIIGAKRKLIVEEKGG